MKDGTSTSPHDGASNERHPPGPLAHRRRTSLLLFLSSLVVALLLGEIVLRIIGFRYELRLHMIESTAPNPAETVQRYRVDRDLAWVPEGYADSLRAARLENPKLVFLGDSCTQLGWYDEYFADYVAALYPGAAVRTAKLGCAGYTTHQGLAQLERDIVPLHPLMVTLYYGWNDHWLSIGVDDEQVTRLNASPLYRVKQLRLAQLANKVAVTLQRRRLGHTPLRVSPEQFRSNLVDMVRVARQARIVPILITAPTSHTIGSEPAYLEGRWIDNLSNLVPLHRRYVQIVREVAAQEQAPLCDLAVEFEALAPAERSVMFNPDGIHATEDGNRAIASGLLECLEQHGLLGKLIEE